MAVPMRRGHSTMVTVTGSTTWPTSVTVTSFSLPSGILRRPGPLLTQRLHLGIKLLIVTWSLMVNAEQRLEIPVACSDIRLLANLQRPRKHVTVTGRHRPEHVLVEPFALVIVFLQAYSLGELEFEFGTVRSTGS